MPIEAITFQRLPIPPRCPACRATFEPFLRGQVSRGWGVLTSDFALICRECKNIVGYENKDGYALYSEARIAYVNGPGLILTFFHFLGEVMWAGIFFLIGLAWLAFTGVCWIVCVIFAALALEQNRR